FAADGRPVTVELPATTMRDGESMQLAPTDWQRLDTAPIDVVLELHGRQHRRRLKARTFGARFARVAQVQLTSGTRAGGAPPRLPVAARAAPSADRAVSLGRRGCVARLASRHAIRRPVATCRRGDPGAR